MNTVTCDALEASIRRWRMNVDAKDPNHALCLPQDCALCEAFPDDLCTGCPVKNKTGKRGCVGSPYFEAYWALIEWKTGNGSCEKFRATAQEELDFLISLRPLDGTEKLSSGEVSA